MYKILAVIMVFALSGCATTGGSPVVDLNMSQANSIEYPQALKDCNAIASANTNVAGSAATGAVVGAAISAGLFAAVGAIIGVDVGLSAAVGAAVGGVQNALRGASGSLETSQQIVRNCLKQKGFAVYN
jgi:hypothetical protein